MEEFTRTKLKTTPADLSVAFASWAVGHTPGMQRQDARAPAQANPRIGAAVSESNNANELNAEARRLARENWGARPVPLLRI